MLVEIKGVQFSNKGAELMLHAIIQKVKNRWPEIEFCLAPNKNSPYIKRTKVAAYQKIILRKNIFDLSGLFYFIPKKIRTIFKDQWGIVTEADIDVILDASGFAYGDQWSTLILKQTAIEIKRLKKKGKHYVFMPQALGPFTHKHNRIWAKKTFVNASLVFAREQKSLEYVQSVDQELLVAKAPDFTNLLVPTLDEKYKRLSGGVGIVPNSKMLSEKNSHLLWRENYVDILVETIDVLMGMGENVFLLNHEGELDYSLCEVINNKLNQSIEIISPDNSLQVKAIIGQCRLLVCSRYHGCVSALSQLVPCIATSWSHKYEELFDDYGQLAMLMSADVKGALLNDFVCTAVACLEETKLSLIEPATRYKIESEEMWRKVEGFIITSDISR